MNNFRTKALALVGTAALSVGLLAACGGDDNGGGGASGADFCDILLDMDDRMAEAERNEDLDGMVAAMRELRAAAPSNLRGHLDFTIDFTQNMIDSIDDPDAMMDLLMSIDEDRLMAAEDAIDEAIAECEDN
ncbi:MAG: hypothetical protein FWG11_05110 [Promicromonosporaceae bacterium]|nr:hypothetical protein [Promicromonosporaceae bacterium]